MNVFPIEILALVSRHLCTFDILLMWLAGDKVLNYKLSKAISTLTLSEIQMCYMGLNIAPFRSIASFDCIVHVNIEAPKRSILINPDFLVLLPQTVQFLKLVFKDSYNAFVVPEGHEKFKITIPSSNEGQNQDTSRSLLHVGRKFPMLHTLLVHDGSYYGYSFKWTLGETKLFLSSMPDTLQSITLEPLEDLFGSQLIGSLPHSLLSYSLSASRKIGDPQDLDLSGLPPHTTSLKALFQEFFKVPFEQLPTSLTDLNLRVVNPVIEKDFYKRLPNSITKLKLDLLASSAEFTALPSNLKCLSLIGLQLRPSPANQLFASLPPCLEQLELGRLLQYDDEMLHWELLPKSLIDFEIDSLPEGVPDFSDFPLLTRLHIESCQRSDVILPAQWFPPSLRTLHMGARTSVVSDGDHFFSSISNLTSLSIQTISFQQPPTEIIWPPGLVLLAVLTPQPACFGFFNFPSTLTSLSIAPLERLEKSFAQALPPGLTYLRITSSSMYANAVEYLPRSLLRIIITKDNNFDDACIKHLPRGLLELSLPSNHWITDRSAPHMPPGLQILGMPLCKNFTLDGVSRLPRTLKTLRLFQIGLPTTCNFPTVLKAMQSLPPWVDWQNPRFSGADLRNWALNMLGLEPM